MTFKHRAIIDSIPSYRQGKPAPVVSGQQAFKISSNENPFDPLPSVREAIASQALSHINRYPNMRGLSVVQRLAKINSVQPENIALGCGSTEVITQLVRLVAGPGDEVVYPWRSFEAYPIIVAGAGAASVQVPNLPNGAHNIDGIIGSVNEHTRLVIINNPNNPTSTSVAADDAKRVVEAVADDVLVLFDEAYFQFNTDADTSVAMDLFREHSNVVVTHTFSKAYGLAGLRIGYAVAAPDVIDGMIKVALPFGVSDVAQTAALASIDAYDELHDRVRSIISERSRVVHALREQGWDFPEPYANFFWLALGRRTEDAAREFTGAGLSTRVFSGEGIRITIGEHDANTRVIEVCGRLKSLGF